MSSVQFKMSMLEALKQLHGEVGKATVVDVLKFDDETHDAIIRVPHRWVWSGMDGFGLNIF